MLVTDGLHRAGERISAAALFAVLRTIAIYQALLSPLLLALNGPACRFEPSCSHYARQALAEHGLRRGLYLTMYRLMRCRPRGGWGYDPVPAREMRDLGQF
jgi:putative membrane protein insertion efficiency factor